MEQGKMFVGDYKKLRLAAIQGIAPGLEYIMPRFESVIDANLSNHLDFVPIREVPPNSHPGYKLAFLYSYGPLDVFGVQISQLSMPVREGSNIYPTEVISLGIGRSTIATVKKFVRSSGLKPYELFTESFISVVTTKFEEFVSLYDEELLFRRDPRNSLSRHFKVERDGNYALVEEQSKVRILS